ncbi:MAG: clan AA aspartic protease [Planctomycetales bacterium]|nr:clan AA aspartic protease [Planctomycetales bacterium]
MITGHIDENLEARIKLSVKADADVTAVEFLLDTGFNGHLSVTRALVETLGLELKDVQSGITADGRLGYFETVDVDVVWHGRETTVRAQVLDEAMLGTRMLKGCELSALWNAGGVVSIRS